MAYLRIAEVQAAGRAARIYVGKSASQILAEDARRFSPAERYDVFLSHSFRDADAILGIRSIMESSGLKVYVDWIEDPELERGNVTVATANVLRDRMKTCSSLVYVHSENATESLWMPWELGYFDGIKPGHVWILPLVSSSDSEFRGQEYLGLYPPVQNLGLSDRIYLGFDAIGGEIPLRKAAPAGGPGVFYPTK